MFLSPTLIKYRNLGHAVSVLRITILPGLSVRLALIALLRLSVRRLLIELIIISIQANTPINGYKKAEDGVLG